MLQEIYKALEKPQSSKYGGVVQKLIAINILINIVIVFSTLTIDFQASTLKILHAIETITVVIFIVELISRYISIGYDGRYKGFRGKISFTFTPFILIDILALIPYAITSVEADILLARVVRFLRFFRILKLLRLRSMLKQFFSMSTFATSSIFVQIIVLFIFSIFFITIFSFAYSGDKTSLLIFLEPSSLAEASSNIEIVFGVIELMLGLFIGGALISIITELIANFTSDIKNGYHPYKDKEHIVIINHNSKLEFILDEINHYYNDLEEMQDIVLFLPYIKNIEAFNQNLGQYTNLNLILLTGDELNWNSYERLNVNYAKKILILRGENNEIQYLDIKITRYILTHDNFNNPNVEFIIESQNNQTIQGVYQEVFYGLSNSYTVIEHNTIIQRFLNRSIVEPDYFKIYLNLLSYDGEEFYRLDASEVFESSISFEDAYMQFDTGVLMGIRKNGKLILNPPKNTIVNQDDKLVTVLKNKIEYTLNAKNTTLDNYLNIKVPNVKTSRDICIVGNFDDINQDNITEFLTTKSIKRLKKVIIEDGDYMQESIWDDIIKQKYDTIILNMEDDYEFILTMYLNNRYKNNKPFLSCLINIIHSPTNAKLIEDKNNKNNIILSEKLVGEYITQVMFNHGITDIFDEITQSKGNEFYILERNIYKELFKLNFEKLKLNLLHSSMIYIGAIKDDEFVVNCKNIEKASKIIVLTQGID